METELIKNLLEKLDTAEYVSILRKINQRNKQLRVPGFTKIEKAPIAIILRTAKSNLQFRSELLATIASAFLSDKDVNWNESADSIMEKLPMQKWLGAVALLIEKNDEESIVKAEEIFSAYNENIESPLELIKETKDEKEGKKEAKFRQKYMKAHQEMLSLEIELNQKSDQLNKANADILDLQKTNLELHSKCKFYEMTIAELQEIQKVLNEDISHLKAINAELTQTEVNILAPNCNDILEGFTENLNLEFNLSKEMMYPDLLDQYDQIWVFPDVVPFGIYRVLQKWEKTYDNKIWIFQNLASMISHANKIAEQYRERN